MKILNNVQIVVHGLNGVGKSHVMSVIKKALESEYANAQVVSYDLQVELNMNNIGDLLKPKAAETIFHIEEGSVVDYRAAYGVGVKENTVK